MAPGRESHCDRGLIGGHLVRGPVGFAIQRGATCTLAAVDEVLTKRHAYGLMSMLQASLWVAGGLALAHVANLAGSMPGGSAASTGTVIGDDCGTIRLVVRRRIDRPTRQPARNSAR